jgi:hypothetical protein
MCRSEPLHLAGTKLIMHSTANRIVRFQTQAFGPMSQRPASILASLRHDARRKVQIYTDCYHMPQRGMRGRWREKPVYDSGPQRSCRCDWIELQTTGHELGITKAILESQPGSYARGIGGY